MHTNFIIVRKWMFFKDIIVLCIDQWSIEHKTPSEIERKLKKGGGNVKTETNDHVICVKQRKLL